MPATSPHLTVTRPGDLAAVVPHLLGYQPHDSLVLCLVQRGLLVEAVRYDLADLPAGRDATQSAQLAAARHLAAAVTSPDPRDSADEIHALWFADPTGPAHAARTVRDARGLLSALRSALASSGPDLGHGLLVTAGAWQPVACPTRDCCPTGPAPVEGSRDAAVTFQFLRPAPAASRTDLAAELAPSPEAAAIADLLPHRRLTGPTALPTVRDLLTRKARTDPDLADLLAGLADTRIRSRAVAEICAGTLVPYPGASLEAVRVATGRHLAGAAAVHAATCWIAGDGARARVALEHAAATGTICPVLGQLAIAVRDGIPPDRIPVRLP